MRSYEKRLLGHLQEDNSQGKNDPLADVKNAMGQIAYSAGNPLTKTEITIRINIYYLDGANVLQPPANLPVVYRTTFPVLLFSLTDFYGGFKRSLTINPLTPLLYFAAPIDAFYLGIWGVSLFRILGIGNVIDTYPDEGDLIYMFKWNFPGGPNWTAIIIIHCNNVAYGTFLNSFVSDLITINTLRLIVPIANINQYVNGLTFGYQTLFGKTSYDTVDPRMYITNTDFQQQICDIPINLPIDKACMLNYQLNWDCVSSQVILFVEKVEPLTHKSNLSKR